MIIFYHTLASVAEFAARYRRKIFLILGTFDGLHPGHIKCLEDTRKIAGNNALIVVGVRSDSMVLFMKGKTPAPEWERSVAITQYNHLVDFVIIVDEGLNDDGILATEILGLLKPHYLVVDKDCGLLQQRRKMCKERKIKIILSDHQSPLGLEGISSSENEQKFSALSP